MLFICGQSFISGGEYALKNLISHMNQTDRSYLICRDCPEIKKFFENHNLIIVGCPYFDSFTELKKKYGLLAYFLKISNMVLFFIFFIRIIFKTRPDIIISNNFSEIPVSIFAFIFRIPFVQYVHEIIQLRSRNYMIIMFFKKFISKFIFVSSASKEAVSSLLNRKNTAIVYNSVDLYPDVSAKKTFALPLKMIFVGMINQNKNPLRFLKWVKILSDKYQVSAKIVYHIYDTELLAACQSHAQAYKLQIEWIKNPSQKSLIDHISSSDFLCSTSFFEAQPLTVLQAMSRGIPVITSQNMGGPEIICDGYTGLVIDDDSELAEKVHLCIQPDIYKKISENCLKEVQKFSHKNRVDKFLEIVNSL